MTPIDPNTHEVLARLAARLRVSGYRPELLAGLRPTAASCYPILEERLSRLEGVGRLGELFLLGKGVSTAPLADVLGSALATDLQACGLLRTQPGGGLASNWMIQPEDALLLFCDFQMSSDGRRLQGDRVYPPGSDSRKLARAQLDEPVSTTLDLCTGSGIQAIIASAASREVVAVDLNPRAVEAAELSLAINGVERGSVLLGDLFEPLGDRRFDRILANPPFVISTTESKSYRDGGARGDDVLQRIVAGLPTHLVDGGYCQIVTFLSTFESGSQAAELERFAEEHDLELLVVSSRPREAETFVRSQLANLLTDYSGYRRRARELWRHLRHHRFLHATTSLVLFRRSGRFRAKHLKMEKSVHFTEEPRDLIARFVGES